MNKCTGIICDGKFDANDAPDEMESCPYREQVLNDESPYCNCCRACQNECYMHF